MLALASATLGAPCWFHGWSQALENKQTSGIPKFPPVWGIARTHNELCHELRAQRVGDRALEERPAADRADSFAIEHVPPQHARHDSQDVVGRDLAKGGLRPDELLEAGPVPA